MSLFRYASTAATLLNDHREKLLEKQRRWEELLAIAEQEWTLGSESFEKESEISYGWDMETYKHFYGDKVEPLPSSVYSGISPRAPTPPPDSSEFSEFSEFISSDSDTEPCDLTLSNEHPVTRRNSPQEGREHNVMEPPFLTADWDNDNFPRSHNDNEVNGTE